jgi:hypothetical protein
MTECGEGKDTQSILIVEELGRGVVVVCMVWYCSEPNTTEYLLVSCCLCVLLRGREGLLLGLSGGTLVRRGGVVVVLFLSLTMMPVVWWGGGYQWY